MKNLILVAVLFSGLLTSCQTPRPIRVIQPAPALREVFRGGELKGLESNDGQFLGTPNEYDMVEHVCSSVPIYDSWGRYVRTSVKCW